MAEEMERVQKCLGMRKEVGIKLGLTEAIFKRYITFQRITKSSLENTELEEK